MSSTLFCRESGSSSTRASEPRLTFTATNRLFDEGGPGVLVWLALLALCPYGVFWVWTRYRRYG